MEAVLWTLVLLSALHITRVHSQPTPEAEITEATRLLESGRIEEAQAIVSRLRALPDPPLQVLFLSGALYSIKGRHDEAAEEFRLMLARDPTLVRPRLELARALFMARQYDAARYHFEQVLASPLPEAVKARYAVPSIRVGIRSIRARLSLASKDVADDLSRFVSSDHERADPAR